MNRSFIALTAFGILLVALSSGPSEAGESLILFGGVGYGDADLDDRRFEAGTDVGWVLGAGVERDLAASFTLEGGVLFVKKGAIVSADAIEASGSYELDYVCLSALGRYHAPFSGFAPFAGVGVELGMLREAKLLSQDQPIPVRSARGRMDVVNEFAPLDVGVVVSLGLSVPGAHGPLRLEVRRTLGIVDVAESDDLTWHTRATYVLVGWSF